MINPRSVLDVPMQDNDANAATIRDYLICLLSLVWEHGEGFSGKRPFGNSGWESELLVALAKAGIIQATFDEDGYLAQISQDEDDRGMRLISAAIISLGWIESPEPEAFV